MWTKTTRWPSTLCLRNTWKDQTQILADFLTWLFNVVLGQCTLALKDCLKSHGGYAVVFCFWKSLKPSSLVLRSATILWLLFPKKQRTNISSSSKGLFQQLQLCHEKTVRAPLLNSVVAAGNDWSLWQPQWCWPRRSTRNEMVEVMRFVQASNYPSYINKSFAMLNWMDRTITQTPSLQLLLFMLTQKWTTVFKFKIQHSLIHSAQIQWQWTIDRVSDHIDHQDDSFLPSAQ